jgi:hypothetical protein
VRALPTTAVLIALASGPAGAAEVLSVRPIQVDYPTETGRQVGQVVALWQLQGIFDQIHLSTDGGPTLRVLDGSATTGSLGDLSLGDHRLEVAGVVGGVVISLRSAPITVLASPPLPGVVPDGCLFYGYLEGEGGLLDIFWKNQDLPSMRYVDYQVLANGILQGVLPAPADTLSFNHVPLGVQTFEVVAYTFDHLCPAATISCKAEQVAPVSAAACRFKSCDQNLGTFGISYVLPGSPLDGVAAFDVTAGPPGAYLGSFPPGEEIPVSGIRPGTTMVVELAAFHGDSASTLPAAPGPHTTVMCALPADGCLPDMVFRRGDCNGDGRLDITDDIFHLDHLFSGGPPPTCEGACDVNDDGRDDVSDPIAGLAFKFLGGPAPEPPYPGCGSSAGGLPCKAFAGCPPR